MIEIKFRVWNKISKKMQYNNDEENRFYINIDGSLTTYFKSIRGWESGSNLVSKGLYILQQFTGLHDKNGKDIYEGDILKEIDERGILEDKIYEVAWDDKETGFAGFTYGYYRNASLFKFMEVIGNIHENPELLEG